MQDLIGKKFGRWLVTSRAEYGESGARWHCECECGTEKIVIQRTLIQGRSVSCGCYAREQRVKKLTRHGHNKEGKRTKTYNTWHHMKRRCKDKNHRNHKSYYDKGIKVCERWEDFTSFLEDMGERPEGKTLDRIDGDKGYHKENCRWATPKEQANNMSRNHYLEFNGEKLTISQWADKIGVKYVTLNTRIHRGWSVKRALTIK